MSMPLSFAVALGALVTTATRDRTGREAATGHTLDEIIGWGYRPDGIGARAISSSASVPYRLPHALPVEPLSVRAGRMAFGIAWVERGWVERPADVAPQRRQEIASTGAEQSGGGGVLAAVWNRA